MKLADIFTSKNLEMTRVLELIAAALFDKIPSASNRASLLMSTDSITVWLRTQSHSDATHLPVHMTGNSYFAFRCRWSSVESSYNAVKLKVFRWNGFAELPSGLLNDWNSIAAQNDASRRCDVNRPGASPCNSDVETGPRTHL